MASIFTKIISGEIPCYQIGEDDRYFAFLDINPVSEGHTLVVPKTEEDYLFNLDDDNLAGLIQFAKKVAHGIDAALGTLRTGIVVEGLEVPHAHIHLIPIYYKGQAVSLGRKLDVSEARMNELATLISKNTQI